MDLNCQAAGCDHAPARLVPDARGREESLGQLVHAPIACFCCDHADLLSDCYAQAVAGALITQYSHGIRVDLDHVQALCEQLQTMPTDIAQATYAILIRLEGIK
jgi:hypothetical protein